ncbi:MAG: D-sedoheptulose 7-phosphate isomerase [Gloeobacteraceae cyanobacterium ES-bin-316]|nr:D-sedoheptulose 7-phosphate isomerase [Ferruginibacter sp.]
MTDTIKNIIQASIHTKQSLLSDELTLQTIYDCVELITASFKNGNKLLFCGNGGSAADAQHLAAELSGRFYKDRACLPAEALHVNSSYLTAVANDHGFDLVYSRLLSGIGKKGDVLFALSTSGNSTNIINAISMAKKLGMICIGLSGATAGKMNGICDHLIKVPSNDPARIQETHILIGHIICQLVEEKYFTNTLSQ